MSTKKTATKAGELMPAANPRTSGDLQLNEQDASVGREIGAAVDGDLDALVEAVKVRMNAMGREMVRLGYELLAVKSKVGQGSFEAALADLGISSQRASEFMRSAKVVSLMTSEQRAAALALHKSKLNLLAAADPQVIEQVLADGIDNIDTLSVRKLRDRIRELEEQTADLAVQRDTAETEVKGLKKKLAKQPGEREDEVPLAVADLRADLMAYGQKASLSLDSINAMHAQLDELHGTDEGHEWADATLRLVVSQLGALRLQIDGLLKQYLHDLPGQDPTPTERSYLTKQEVLETARRFQELARTHEYEAQLREWERAQERPRGKGRPAEKPLPPGSKK